MPQPSESVGADIAVVGMAGRFPGASTPTALWDNVRAGVESIRVLTIDELAAAGVSAADLADPQYVRACAPLDEMEEFDAGFFGFSPRDASILDPQHRHFLECAWEALESAGHPPERFAGSIGVFAGCGMGAYFAFNLLSHPELVRSTGVFLLRHTGNDKDFLPTRVSYLLNLTGPSLAIQTACSTSLVAIHVAAQHLLNGECDMAIAGGVTIELPHRVGYRYEPGEILSPDGHCRAFDAASKGTVFGSGVGVVVLRRLQDALDDGDEIHAVIKGSAVNNDGGSKVGYLAPSVEGQAAAIAEALAVAGLTADAISYVEAHGTGTPVGDPIEIAALTQAFRQTTTRSGFCGLGSLKTNIGHLDTAAGVASFIKVVQALEHRELPPSLHFETPNPSIDFARTPFYVNRALKPWPASDQPRRAGVSSIGVGGTNAHVILEEAPRQQASGPSRSKSLLLLSARSPAALDALAARYAADLAARADLNIADAAYTTAVGRRAFAHRRAIVCASAAEAAAHLRLPDARERGKASGHPAARVVMMFPGGGAQYPAMARDLHREEPAFREAMERGLALAARGGLPDIRDLLYPDDGRLDEAGRSLERPSCSVVSVFLVEYALAELWKSWGVTPAALIGHSLGEYVAAVLAGVMTLDDALAIVAARGAIFDRLPEGAMLSVALPEGALRQLAAFEGLSIAAVNAPELSVASGPTARIAALERALEERGIESRRLHIGVAAHSAMLEPFLDEFRRVVSTVALEAPQVPFASNLSGGWANPADVATPEYWVRHLRSTVRFSEGLTTVLDDPGRVLLEVGPGQTLTSLARLHRADGKLPVAIPSLRRPQDHVSDVQTILEALGRLWTSGVEIDWDAFYAGERRRRVSLPTYAFEHQRYWIDRGQVIVAAGEAAPVPAPCPSPVAPERLPAIADWVASRRWRETLLDRARSVPAPSRCLVFGEAAGIGSAMAAALRARGHRVTLVLEGPRFRAVGPNCYEIDPRAADQFGLLVSELAASNAMPDRVVHAWLADPGIERASPVRIQSLGFDAVLGVIRAIGAHDPEHALDLTVVTAGLERLDGDSRIAAPGRATVAGPVRVLGREYPSMRGRLVDLPLGATADDAVLTGALVDEVLSDVDAAAVALRGDRRFVESIEPLPLDEMPDSVAFVERGAYLITGGSSGIGLALSEQLAPLRPRLALVGRTPIPPRASWHEPNAGWSDEVARRIAAIKRLEAAGADVLPLVADVTDERAMKEAVASAVARFGRLDGVLHAAGVIDDGLMQVKAPEQMARVLAPKVAGTLALEGALGDGWPGFLVLFSSTSAFLGLAGQADYTGANAFLNAVARARDGQLPRRTIAVQWGVWKHAGMAARAVGAERAPGRPAHALLGAEAGRTEREATFSAEWRAGDLWVLDEHRLSGGPAICPGTGFIELVRAAGRRVLGVDSLLISDLLFQTPLEVPDTERRHVRTALRHVQRGEWSVSVSSRGDADVEWTEHVTASVARGDPSAESVSLDALRAGCTTAIAAGSPVDVRAKQGAHVGFGPRWQALRGAAAGKDAVLVTLSLDERFAADVETYGAHPALLDLATACGLALVPGYAASADLFVPFSYRRLELRAPLPASIVASARLSGEPDATGATATFDVTVTDDRGRVLATAREFTMRRVTAAQLDIAAGRPSLPRAVTGRPLLESLVAAGITPAEGFEALSRVLRAPHVPEVIVSSVAPAALVALANEQAGRRVRMPGSAGPARAGQESGGTAEQAIAGIWEDLLGVRDVGPDDNFFELGGHSLIAVRLVGRIEKRFKTRLRLSALFEAPTVRQLAQLVAAPVDATPRFRSLTALRATGSKNPLFCVHSVGGELLSYRALAAAFDPDRPFYGFRCLGHDGSEEPLRDIGEQAELYLREMRQLRPKGPYVLAGYSHGGRVAFEMATRLQQAGEDVAFLGIIDTWSHEQLRRGFLYPARFAANLLKWIASDLVNSPWPHNWDRLWRARQVLTRQARGLLAPLGVRTRTRQIGESIKISHLPPHIQRTFEANFEAFVKFQPGRFAGRVHVFRSAAQPLAAPLRPDHGWGEFVDGRVIVTVVPGNHSSILTPPHVSVLAQALSRAVDAAESLAPQPYADPAAVVSMSLTSQS